MTCLTSRAGDAMRPDRLWLTKQQGISLSPRREDMLDAWIKTRNAQVASREPSILLDAGLQKTAVNKFFPSGIARLRDRIKLEHRDSSGGGGKIGAGDVQWMTAGNGIVHEEFHSQDFTRKGGTFQMAQLWVNLRAKDKRARAGYQTLLKAQIPNITLPQGAGTVRVIAGDYNGRKGAAKTFSPINLWDVNLRAGKSAELPLPDGHTTTFLVLSGEVQVDGERDAGEGDLAIFARAGDGITVKAKTDAKLLVMGGEPFDEPVVGHGPFVMNSQAEIQQAFEEYQLGRMGEIPS